MRESEELSLLELEPAELRTLLAIKHFAGEQDVVEVTMDELATVTKYGRTTLSNAVAGLAIAGFLKVERTKRNFGKLFVNRYTLLPCSVSRTPTGGTGDSNDLTVITNIELTTDKPYSHMQNSKHKEILVGKQKWNEGDDDIAGFGLLKDDKPKIKQDPKADKQDPKTRKRRPIDTWSAADVAVEFAHRIVSQRRFMMLAGTLHTGKLTMALATNRKRAGTTPEIELEVLERFIADERIMSTALDNPEILYKRYLRMIQDHLNRKYVTPENAPEPVATTADDSDVDYVYASDGKRFDNSMLGRRFMKQYEESLSREQ